MVVMTVNSLEQLALAIKTWCEEDAVTTTITNHHHNTNMPDIKLLYFDLKARAEPARLLLAYGGVTYEDERIPPPWENPSVWAERKPKMAWGQLPELTWDGEVIYTSISIARFLAREFGLMGKTSVESAQVDEVVDVVQDTLNAGYTAAFTQDEAEKKKKLEKHSKETIPAMLKMAEKKKKLEKHSK